MASRQPRAPVSDSKERPALLLQKKFLIAVMLTAYLGTAYLIMPEVWHSYMRRHPSLDDVPGITLTHSQIPGDPLNVGLVGTEEQVMRIMLKAKWHPADPITLKSSLRIAADSVLHREYADAPVSSLYLFGRKEDLAFELPVGQDPRKRNHVRFWKSNKADPDGRPFWFGAATYDERVGFSHTTGQITHHIAGDIDQERNKLLTDLNATGDLTETYTVVGFHKTLTGRNGGGDRWWTDGNLRVGVISPAIGE